MKGDLIRLVTVSGAEAEVSASRRGRRVTSRVAKVRGLNWVIVEEVTRGGRPTGTSVRVRADQVAFEQHVLVEA